MRIHKILLETRAEGPGLRACIWVQGCHHGCKGCFATHLWDEKLGTEMSVEEVIAQLETVLDRIDGVTFLGGEPFEQAGDLWQIAKFAREAGKNVLTFTGYTYEQLTGCESISKTEDGYYFLSDIAEEHQKSVDAGKDKVLKDIERNRKKAAVDLLQDLDAMEVEKLLEYTDLLADGPFIQDLLSYDRPMLGSSNQRFIFLTDAISREAMENYRNSFEVRVSPQGKVQINGMGNVEKLKEYLGSEGMYRL